MLVIYLMKIISIHRKSGNTVSVSMIIISKLMFLAEMFEEQRDMSQNYGLDLSWCYKAPGLACDAVLKDTNQ